MVRLCSPIKIWGKLVKQLMNYDWTCKQTNRQTEITKQGYPQRMQLQRQLCGIYSAFLSVDSELQVLIQLSPSLLWLSRTLCGIKHGSTLYIDIYDWMDLFLGGFFHGLTPRLLRRSLMAAISWSVYENLSVYIQR